MAHATSSRRARLSLLLAAGAGALTLTALTRPARAEQFVLFDATIDYTWEDAQNSSPSLSHFYVNDENFLNTERPDNWLSPVDYRNGTLHVRTEVFEKPPGDQQVGWTLCYIPNSGGYGCADTTYYTSTGVFDRETSMTDWWNNDQINWEQGIKQMDLIYAIDDSGSGHITNYPELKDQVTPTRVRITMVQVSAGSTYDPSIIELPGEGGAGGSGGSAGSGGAGIGGSLLGGSGGVAGGGYGGLLGMAGGGMPGSSGAPQSAGSAGSSSAGAGGGAVPPAAASKATNEGGCAIGGARGGALGLLSFSLAGMLALAVRRRKSR